MVRVRRKKEKTVRQKEAAESTRRMECCRNDCKLKRVKERNVKKERKIKKNIQKVSTNR